MDTKQLQEVVIQCKEFLQQIERVAFDSQKLSKVTLSRQIKKRRAQIKQIKQDIGATESEIKNRTKLNKYIKIIQAQISNVKTLAAKQQKHFNQLERYCQKMQLKLSQQQQKMVRINREQQLLKQFEAFVQEKIKQRTRYESLQAEHDRISGDLLEETSNQDIAFKGKRSWMEQIAKNNLSIDEKIDYLTSQIAIQQQIIREISHIEKLEHQADIIQTNPKKQLHILTNEQSAIFKKDSELGIWEKHQLQNILLKKSFQRVRDTRRAGSIVKQRFTTQISFQNKHQNRKSNFSADLVSQATKIVNRKEIPIKHSFHFVSNHRIKQLQNNKRIRTRFSSYLLSTPKFKPNKLSLQQQKQQSEHSSILSIYESFKRQKNLGNLSAVKLKRKQNKRKCFQTNKGVPIEVEHFD